MTDEIEKPSAFAEFREGLTVIAPAVLSGGKPDWIAAAITAVAAFRLPLPATVVIGVVSVVALRAVLI